MTSPARSKYLIAGGIVLLLALLLARFFGGTRPDGAVTGGGRGTAPDAIQVRVEEVRASGIGGTVSAVGTLLPNEEVQVRSQVSGQIERIAFSEGARVRKGELLLTINDDELQAQLLRANSRLAIGEQQAERQKQLFLKNFVSQEEYNNALNELNVVRAEAQLIAAMIAKTEIRAPFDGTVGLRFVSEGSYVSPATAITMLQDNATMKVDFTVPEKYAGLIGEGDSITFKIQTRPESFPARIYSTDSRIDAATRTLRMRAATPNPGRVLLPGSFANVEVTLQARSSLTIPAYALIPELRGHKVYLCVGGVAEARPVVIGQRTSERVEITGGLSDGDSLITSGILQLRPGMPVRPAPAEGQSPR